MVLCTISCSTPTTSLSASTMQLACYHFLVCSSVLPQQSLVVVRVWVIIIIDNRIIRIIIIVTDNNRLSFCRYKKLFSIYEVLLSTRRKIMVLAST
jgi:hypothetical protein